MREDEYLSREQRNYVRLDTVFPVQFRLENPDGSCYFSGWVQGFTSNLSKGGICLCVNNFPNELLQLLKEHKAKVSLEIDLPISRKPISARAVAIWIKDIPGEAANKYYIGLSYEKIDAAGNKLIMRYARGRKILVPLGLTLIVLLGTGLIFNSLLNIKLTRDNKILVQQLVSIVEEAKAVKQQMGDVAREKEALEAQIKSLASRIKLVEEERASLANKISLELDEQSDKIKELNSVNQQLAQEKSLLNEQLIAVRNKEDIVSKEMVRIDKKRASLEKANFDKMYKWIEAHQNPDTGLVISFEGDSDISGWAFIYDQSLVAQANIYFNDLPRARRILDFFYKRAAKKGNLFFNAYYALDGAAAEYIVHSGPNIWLGIAAAQYTYKTQDKRYINLAEDIARGIIELQGQDSEGGIPGGPGISWYATEHNLDAYAFFNMLYNLTGKQKYEAARNKALNWIVKNTYNKTDIPVKRGKGDSTIATDTYAWSIAAVGPEKLAQLGMDPERIMEFAETNCAAEVIYLRPEGQEVKVKGFDFAPQRHVARGGIVSSEWTAQMVIAFKIMAEYYLKNKSLAEAENYRSKADAYLGSLENMVISSPSPSGQGASCLPYATQDFVDTGHGWFTPKGKSTGSLAGTAYTIFAYYSYNPLELKD